MQQKIGMRRTFCLISIVALLAFGCQTHRSNNSLVEVDSLVVAELYDSAYHLVTTKLESANFTPEEQAHYDLLKVQTSILANKPLESSDSILDGVISYYNQHVNHERLANAYYYKALGYSIKHDFKKSILLYKKAEQLADKTGNRYLLYKIYEGIAYINMICGKYNLQQNYAKKALEMAKIIGQKHWIAYSYYNLAFADLELGFEDSAVICLKRISPYIKYVNKIEKPILLSSMGYLLLDNNPEEAKSYLFESLKYQELTATYMYLAEICEEEGEVDKAYEYWKKALLTKDTSPKDAAIRNIIEYDMERGKTDSICERINEIIAIVGLAAYSIIKRYRSSMVLKNYQMQIIDYTNQIREMELASEDYSKQIETLSQEVKQIMDEKSPRLSEGRMLYDSIMEGRPIVKWSADDEKKFIEYFTATNYRLISHLRKEPRRENLTDHKLIYLLLKEMGKTDKEVCDIMGLSDAGLRSIRNRTKPLKDAAG